MLVDKRTSRMIITNLSIAERATHKVKRSPTWVLMAFTRRRRLVFPPVLHESQKNGLPEPRLG